MAGRPLAKPQLLAALRQGEGIIDKLAWPPRRSAPRGPLQKQQLERPPDLATSPLSVDVPKAD